MATLRDVIANIFRRPMAVVRREPARLWLQSLESRVTPDAAIRRLPRGVVAEARERPVR